MVKTLLAAYALLLAILLGQWAQVATFREGLTIGAVTGMLFATIDQHVLVFNEPFLPWFCSGVG
jgi:hypothetical protein